MREWLELSDELGPEKIFHVYDPKVGMKGVVVVDTTSMGVAGGGTRMLLDITTKEIFELARAMTYKFAMLDFPIGGSKAGIWADPGIFGAQRQDILKAFGNAIKPLLESGVTVAADIGTDVEDVATIYEGAGVPLQTTGLSLEEIDGEPLENHATGYGVVVAAKAACDFADRDIKGVTVAIEGFGKVGGGVARYMAEEGAKVVAISTIEGTLYNSDGLDVNKLLVMRKEFGDRVVKEYKGARLLDKGEIYFLPVDILIPGARPYVIDKSNADRIQAKVISSIANVPITDEAEDILFNRKILSVPDFISNAGGVLVALVDILGGTADDVFRALRELIGSNTRDIITDAYKQGINPRALAVKRVTEKVLKAREGKEPVPTFEELLKLARQRLKM
ncbi:MAG: Glu/Leu/Phe/Val dehydrogenase [Deltaproteobacteria bacterium]|nr:Glu/Leu/Phe/Val dehydrogenase [Deltaproteobacteria bacterium]